MATNGLEHGVTWSAFLFMFWNLSGRRLSEDVIELLIYHQPGVKPSLTLCPFGILGYVAGHSLTEMQTELSEKNGVYGETYRGLMRWNLSGVSRWTYSVREID